MADLSAFLADQGIDPTQTLPAEDTQADLTASADPAGLEVEGATEPAPADPVAAQGQPADPSFAQSFDPSTLAPELQPAYRQMQADYTRKTQEIAAARQALQSDPAVQTITQLRDLAQRDPAGYVQVLENYAVQARQWAAAQGVQIPGGQQQAAEDPSIDPDLFTDTERAIYSQVEKLNGVIQNLQQRLAHYEPTLQQANLDKGIAQVEAAVSHIETNIINRKMEPAERDQFYDFCVKQGVRTREGMEMAARAWDHEKAVQRGRDQAAAAAAVKQQMRPAGRPVTPGVGAGAGAAPKGKFGGWGNLVDQAMAGKL